jgi:hypothetical protein
MLNTFQSSTQNCPTEEERSAHFYTYLHSVNHKIFVVLFFNHRLEESLTNDDGSRESSHSQSPGSYRMREEKTAINEV